MCHNDLRGSHLNFFCIKEFSLARAIGYSTHWICFEYRTECTDLPCAAELNQISSFTARKQSLGVLKIQSDSMPKRAGSDRGGGEPHKRVKENSKQVSTSFFILNFPTFIPLSPFSRLYRRYFISFGTQFSIPRTTSARHECSGALKPNTNTY